ncbi:MAG: response regulator [Gammaproteobacteria bacterium]|nr:response regulator [Gammaproteobacteria bacterium]
MPQPVRILVVDDEASIRKSLVEFLADYNFEVSSAESAEEALTLLAKTQVDAAVIDLRLPGMSGEGLILHIHEKLPGMRFLIHTGSAGYRLSEELKGIGLAAEHVFFKPLPDLAQLVEGIKKL